jgi:pilus assembly protein CpaE
MEPLDQRPNGDLVIVVAEPSPQRRDQIRASLPLLGDVVAIASLDELEHLPETDGSVGRVLILGPGLDVSDALRYAEKVEREALGTATLLVLDELDASRMREALRSGVDDVLTVSATEDEWSEAIARSRARSAAERTVRGNDTPGGPRGRIVTVFSTKGGCGRSLVASNLAILAAQVEEQRVALVDLDLQSGDLAVMLQLVPALSIYDAAQSASRLDSDAVEGYLTPHPTGVSLLAAPSEPSLADQVGAGAVSRLLELLREMFTLVVVDTASAFTEQVLAALDASDQVVLVGSMDVPSIKNLRMAVATLNQLGHPREHLRIVLNRADSKVGLRVSEVERSLGTSVDVRIPSSRDVPLSINQGTPLAGGRRRSTVVNAIEKLVPWALPDAATARRQRRRLTR